jgi:AcrR family transcriptional regulator
MSDRILDAALNLFIEKGYAGTSTRAIAQGAGRRSVSGLYNHYANKEAIMYALMARHSPYDAFREVLATAHSVEGVIKRLLLLAAEHDAFLQLVQIDARELDGRTLQTLITNEGLQPETLIEVAELLRAEGIRPMEPIVFVRLLATLALGYASTRLLVPGEVFNTYTSEEWAETFATIITQGLYV